MFYFLVSVNIIAIILMLFMLAICLRKKLSKAQLAFIIYDIFFHAVCGGSSSGTGAFGYRW